MTFISSMEAEFNAVYIDQTESLTVLHNDSCPWGAAASPRLPGGRAAIAG